VLPKGESKRKPLIAAAIASFFSDDVKVRLISPVQSSTVAEDV
jgi:hypothetical protein